MTGIGYKYTKGTTIIKFMMLEEINHILKDQVVTYVLIVPDYQPQMEDPNHVQITAGDNIINYLFVRTTRTADLMASKIMWNGAVSKYPRGKIFLCGYETFLSLYPTC